MEDFDPRLSRLDKGEEGAGATIGKGEEEAETLGEVGGRRGTGAFVSEGFMRLGLGTKISPFESSELLSTSQLHFLFLERAAFELGSAFVAASGRRLTVVFAIDGGVAFARVAGFMGLVAFDCGMDAFIGFSLLAELESDITIGEREDVLLEIEM